MTREKAIRYWEKFDAEIDEVYSTASSQERAVLMEQRKVVEFTISALSKGVDFDPVKPLTLDELWQMDGEPVWVVCNNEFEPLAFWVLVEVCEESIFLTNNLGGRTEYATDVEFEDDGVIVYRHKPEEGA